MTDPHLLTRVEQALATLTDAGQPITFAAVATTADISRTTLYRNPNLRALVNEHRLRAQNARTLTGLTTDITHLTGTLDALAARIRQHEERLRRLEHRPASKN